jgi:hypothetical protein
MTRRRKTTANPNSRISRRKMQKRIQQSDRRCALVKIRRNGRAFPTGEIEKSCAFEVGNRAIEDLSVVESSRSMG